MTIFKNRNNNKWLLIHKTNRLIKYKIINRLIKYKIINRLINRIIQDQIRLE